MSEIDVGLYIYIYIYMCVCVCVCVLKMIWYIYGNNANNTKKTF